MSVAVDQNVAVPMSDGTLLAADVYRPVKARGCPTVVLRTPYDRRSGGSYGQQVNALRLAEAGYAVVVQDVRGRYGSHGEFYPFWHEGDDGFDTVEWAASQSWSNGAVGMVGTSYCGFAQVLAARRNPPSLKAWLPALTPLDARSGWVYVGDAFCLGFNLSWTLAHIAPRDRRTDNVKDLLRALDSWKETSRRPLWKQPACVATPAAAYYFDWIERRNDPGYWQAQSGRGIGPTAPPAVVIAGWYDVFGHGSFDLHHQLVHSNGRGIPHRLIVGPWEHAPPPLGSMAGECEFGTSAAIDLDVVQRAWFDTFLLGESEPDWPAAQAFVTGRNAWAAFSCWPPPHALEAWYLQPSGSLSPSAPNERENRFTVDADDPTPTAGGLLCCWKGHLAPGPVDQRSRSSRTDVLSYTSEPMPRELLVAGPARAEIRSTTSGRSADVFVTLVDVAPDGRALNVAEGVRRHEYASSDAKLFNIDLGHLAHAFGKGHRIRVDVSAMSFPRFDRRPKRGKAERTIFLGASRVLLPIAS